MTSGSQLRDLFLKFYSDQGHQIIPPAPLVLANDPTTLFTSSGMQPLVPYLLGQTHPSGRRLVDSQPSFRSQDIEEVGDNRHTTFFEMLGNWSLGDYFKKEQLTWYFRFLTDVLQLDPSRLYVTVFAGDPSTGVPQDDEAISIWQTLFSSKNISAPFFDASSPQKLSTNMKDSRIFAYGVAKNWWSRSGVPSAMPAGEPGGPDSEVFYDFGPQLRLHENSPYKDSPCHPNCDCGRFLEIGNSVFMQYQKQVDGSLRELDQKNVDFGGGLERTLAALNNQPDIYQTDLFQPIIKAIEALSGKVYEGENSILMRVIADHLKAATFMIAEGVEPSNKQQGYMLRRLLRRSAIKMQQLKSGLVSGSEFESIAAIVISIYPNYLKLEDIKPRLSLLTQEIDKFNKALERGLKEIEKTPLERIDATFAFNLFQSYGFPFEVTQEILSSKGKDLIRSDFDREFEKHQQLSRTSSTGMFKGGLANQSEVTTKYHTATHLLQQSLREVLGDHVHQAGSNITSERLRFDFTHDKQLSGDEIAKVETIINAKITADLPVSSTVMSFKQAVNDGALAFFKERYPSQVTVYTIGNYSKEICGGPHVTSTGQIGTIKISRQESVGAGIRRVYLQLLPNGNKESI